MKELQTFISRAVDDYLAAFNCKPLITARSVGLWKLFPPTELSLRP